MSNKTGAGNFFEDFTVGQTIIHATPRTVTTGDVALYTALYGGRFAVQSSDEFARAIGYARAPVDDFLVFHIVFGKTVADISLNAVANLGYAEGRFLAPVFPGDTLSSTSDVIGVKQTSNGKTGIVWVRTTGRNQHGREVLSYVRWVLVRKRDADSPAPETVVPQLVGHVPAGELGGAVPPLDAAAWDDDLSGSPHRFGDYAIGEKIDHVDGMTVEEAEHAMATRAYQNTARVHFNRHTEVQGRFGKRLVYGGHVISTLRALGFNGLGNAFHIAAINGGTHAGPCFARDTIYGWSEVLDAQALPDRDDLGALRLRSVAVKNRAASDFPAKDGAAYAEGVLLDLDYWALMPR
jgi:2-methylfumaryl-CoA hydratase